MDRGQRGAGFRQDRIEFHGFCKSCTSLARLVFLQKGHAEEVMGACELRVIFHHSLEEGNGLIRVPFGQTHSRVEEAPHQVLVVLFEDVFYLSLCLTRLPCVEIMRNQLVAGDNRTGIHFCRTLIAGERLVSLAKPGKEIAQVNVRLFVLRLESSQLLQRGFYFGPFAIELIEAGEL